MEEAIDKEAVYAVEVSLRKDGIELHVEDSDNIRDEIERILVANEYFE